jgi:hypothetical protein
MSPSNEITALLCDEAYLTLCRKSPEDGPEGAAETPKDSLKKHLARIDALEDTVKSTLHAKLREHLQGSSPDYRFSAEVLSTITAWENEVNPYGDCLVAFTRELKSAARALVGPRINLYASFNPRAEAVSGLRLSAESVDHASLRLDAAAKNLRQAITGTVYEKVRVLAPPIAGMAQWMERLALLSNVDALVEMQAREIDLRPLLANKLLVLHACATTARETVGEVQRDYLKNYWDNLRQYALTNYVEDRTVDEVLNELTARYVAANQQVVRSEPALLFA